MDLRKRLLWVDCLGGLAVGLLLLLVVNWLSDLYRIPRSIMLGMAAANVLYGTFSLSLAIRKRRPLVLLSVLAVANMLWGLVCFALAFWYFSEASPLGLASFVFEGIYVGGLGCLEWRWRKSLQDA